MPPINNTQPKLYAYGEDVKDTSGKVIGQAKFNTRTGEALVPPPQPVFTDPAEQGRIDARARIEAQRNAQGSQTPAASATNDPIGSVFNLPSLSTITDQENALGELYRKQAAGEDIVDTSKIRSETLAEFQDRINALNRIYDQQLARARQAGVGRVGQGTAVLAARGLAGSTRGAAVQEGILDQNRQEQEAIDAERQAALAEVYGVANTQAIEAARAKREAILGGAKSYIEFLKGADERKKTNLSSTISALLTQGIDPSTMSPDELNSITSKIGASSGELLAAFKEGKIARDATQSELARKIAKEEAELGKITTETQLMKDKFEDDKRRFGLEYAIKQADLGIRQAELGLKRSEFDLKKGEKDGTKQPNPYQIEKMNNTLATVNDLILKAQQNPEIFGRSAALPIPKAARSDAFRNYTSKLDQLKSNIAFGELQAMREASKTGGALGSVAVAELTLLENTLGALDMAQSPKEVENNLMSIANSVRRWKAAVQGQGQPQSGGQIITAPDGQQIQIID